MQINFALITVLSAIIHGTVALPVAQPELQTHQYKKRSYLPTWVGVALTVVIFKVRATALKNEGQVTDLKQQIKELIEEQKSSVLGGQETETVTPSDELITANEEKHSGQKVVLIDEEVEMPAGWLEGEEDEEVQKEIEMNNWWIGKSGEA